MSPSQIANIEAAIILITKEPFSKNLSAIVDLLIEAVEKDCCEDDCECDCHEDERCSCDK